LPVYYREIVLLSGRLPRHLSGLARNDRKFEFAMTRHCTTERYRAAQGRNDYTYLAHDLAARPAGKFQFIALLFHNTDAFGMGNRFDLFFTDPAFRILQEGRMMTA
ncbi:MAG: hypothetical protein ACI4P4_00635, partial [Faecousia sp.]